MPYRAQFPSFTTVVLSARESFHYSDYYRQTRHENCSPSFHLPLEEEIDLMRTIDLRGSVSGNSTFFLPDYFSDDEEASNEDYEDRHLREKGIIYGVSGVITKTRSIIPRLLLHLSHILGIRKGRAVQNSAKESVEFDL